MNRPTDFKKKLMEKVLESQNDKVAFKEIEEEVNKRFFNHQCKFEEFTFLFWDIPRQKDSEEKIKADIEKAFAPEMAVLARVMKKQHGIEQNYVQVSGAFDEKGETICLMFGENEDDSEGIMLTIDKK